MPRADRSFRGPIGRSEGRELMRTTSASRRESRNVPGVDLKPAVADVFARSPVHGKVK
jgi:hypothetical protein